MSMNIAFQASRVIVVVKTGVSDIQKQMYGVWSTPTDVTYEIARAEDPIQAYKDWVMSSDDCVVLRDVFAEDDLLEDRAPVGQELFDPRVEHLQQLDEWVFEMEQNAWTIRPVIV